MNEQQLCSFYEKYNIFMPSQVVKASLKRKSEFFLGRLAAKFALINLGDYSSFIIEKGERGEPIWPELITGSISHSMLNCTQGIAIATASIIGQNFAEKNIEKDKNSINYTNNSFTQFSGIDIEIKQNAEIFKQNPSILNSLMSPQEAKLLRSFLSQIPTLHLILFSAKESLTKALYSKYQKLISFDAMHCIGVDPKACTLIFYLAQIPCERPLERTIQVNYLELNDEIMTYCGLCI